MPSNNIEAQALSLPLDERARLVDRLINSLESPVDDSWFEDLDAEVKSRMEAAERGEIASEEGGRVMTRMWNLLR